jgi:cellulose synthase/poly-beta-1,6-N-acetylglucosamine synthase-like glycosyltransferase
LIALQMAILILLLFYTITILIVFYGLRFRQAAGKPPTGKVSIVIAARNEERSIDNLLQDLCRQSFPASRLEILVADDNSSDQTAAIVQKYASLHKHIILIQVPSPPKGVSPKKFALSRAIQQSSGEFILTTDADCRVGPRWIETMMSYFQPTTGFVIGFSQFGRKGEKLNRIERLQAFDFVELMSVAVASTHIGMPLAASGQNMAYRRTAFEQVGGYSRVAHRISGDDVLLMQLIRKYTDWKIVFAQHPEAFASSRPQPTLKSLVNQRKRWASNSTAQFSLNLVFFLYLVLAWSLNAAVLFFPIASLCTGNSLGFWLAVMAIKASLEGLLALKAVSMFDRRDLLCEFPLWFFAQIPYIVFVGLLGTVGKFQWKDRQHRAIP